jgi:hypothetical protein
MSGKEIKDYILNNDDVYYNIVVLDKDNEKISFSDIKDKVNYDFSKLEEIVIGSGMLLVYYKINERI